MISNSPPHTHQTLSRFRQSNRRPLLVVCAALAATSTGFVVIGATEELLKESVRAESTLATQFPNTAAWTDAKCGNCHAFDATFSHPVEVQADPVPVNTLMLDKGAIACTTCHDDADYEAHDIAIQTGDPMLRMPAQDLCLTCHTSGPTTRQNSHASMQLKAHSGPGEDSADALTITNTDHLNASSAQCLACHDGMIAADAGTDVQIDGKKFSENHPVGMEYPASSAATRWLNLRPREDLDPRIRLHSGIVGCNTCHNVYSQNRSMLVIENDESRLCMACHDL